METVSKQVVLPKEITELADGSGDIIIAAYDAFKDGFQAGQDLPLLLTTLVAKLPTMVGGIENLGAEWQGAKGKFLLAWLIAGEKVFEDLSVKMVK